MNFYGHFGPGRTPPQGKPIRLDVEVEARRLYVQDRWKEAFKQQATDEDWRRWERGREQGQESGLF